MFMKFHTPLLLLTTVASALAFIVPGGEPTATFVGRVLSTGKVGDVSIAMGSDGTFRRSKEKIEDEDRDKIPHWELWKAEVQVQIVEWARADLATNLADRVSVYYQVDWSTNFLTPYGVDVSRSPRLRLSTNQAYQFVCNRLDVGEEINAFRAFDDVTKPATLSLPQTIAMDVRSGDSQVIAPNVHVHSFPPGGTLIEIKEAPVTALLDIYANSSGLELLVASPVKQMASRVIVLPERHGQDWGGGKFLRVIEKALLGQRGIVITRVDDKRASVTYNDALKATPIKDEFTLPTLKGPLTRR